MNGKKIACVPGAMPARRYESPMTRKRHAVRSERVTRCMMTKTLHASRYAHRRHGSRPERVKRCAMIRTKAAEFVRWYILPAKQCALYVLRPRLAP